MKYSKSFRNAILKKVLLPSNRSVYSVAKEAGISVLTINSLMAKLKDGTLEIEQDEDEDEGECTETHSFKAERSRRKRIVNVYCAKEFTDLTPYVILDGVTNSV